MERTYIMIKPDGVQRNLVGEIIARFEKKGYKLAALKVHRVVPHTAQQQQQYNGRYILIYSTPLVVVLQPRFRENKGGTRTAVCTYSPTQLKW